MNSDRVSFQRDQTNHSYISGRNTGAQGGQTHFRQQNDRIQDTAEDIPRFWIGERTTGSGGSKNRLIHGSSYGAASLKEIRFYLSIDMDKLDSTVNRLVSQNSTLSKETRMQAARIRGLGEFCCRR